MNLKSDVERFWSKVDKNGPIPSHVPDLGSCWLWTGAITSSGYGHFCIGYDKYVAHRWIYEQMNGAIGGLDCCHKCDNRACVNLSHLFDGSRSENMMDCVAKGRLHNYNTAKTHCKHGHEFTPNNTRIGFNKHRNKPRRHCKACEQIHNNPSVQEALNK